MESDFESYEEFLAQIETVDITPDEGHLSQEQLKQLLIQLGEIAGSDMGGEG